MRGLKEIAVVASVLAGGALSGEVCTWNPQGSGGWADNARWLTRVPTTGDTVDFNGCTGVVCKADAEILQKVSAITLTGAGSGLILSNDAADGDFEFGVPVSGQGVIIKQGDGVTRMTYLETAEKTGFWTEGGLEVLNGTLYLPRKPTCDLHLKRLTVMEPGVFVHTGEKYTRVKEGLWGSGTVSNDLSKPLYLAGGTKDRPAVFSGKFVSQAYPCQFEYPGATGNKYQYFTGTESTNSKNPLLYATDGVLGFAKIGDATAAPTSAGRSDMRIDFRGLRGCVRYLGTGERVTRILSYQVGARDVAIDAGEHGGLNMAYKVLIQQEECNGMNALTLTGKGENVFDAIYSSVTNPMGRYVSHYLTKEGIGLWHLKAGKDHSAIGTIDVRKGVLSFDSVAERGTDCAIGPANVTHSKYYGTHSASNPHTFDVDDSKALPYAISLGNGTDGVDDEHLATFSYRGETAASVSTRPIAVNGAGRLQSTAAPLVWNGVTSVGPGSHSLVLDAEECPIAVVATNGLGTLNVVKEGSGHGVLASGSRLSGTVAVNAGTLAASKNRYEWYKLTVTETWHHALKEDGTEVPGGGGSLTMRQFSLRDDQGVDQVLGLTHNKAADGKPWLLEPGQAAVGVTDYRILGTDDFGRNVTWALSNLFTTAEKEVGIVRYRNGDKQYKGVNTPEEMQISFVMRLPEGANPVSHYDIRCQGYWPATDSSCLRMPRAWRVEGSADGLNWKTLSVLTTNDNTYANIPTLQYGRWYSNNTRTAGEGYALAPSEVAESVLHLSGLTVAQGAAFDGRGSSVEVSGLEYDCSASSAGVVSGVTFADDAAVRLTHFTDSLLGRKLPLELSDCRGLVERTWPVFLDGVLRRSYAAEVFEDGIVVHKRGMVLIFR